jgi:hypothetical protein
MSYSATADSRFLPLSAKIVAWLLIILGSLGITAHMVLFVSSSMSPSSQIWESSGRGFRIDMMLLLLPFVGLGLLKGSRGWRMVALIICWSTFLASPMALLIKFIDPSSVNIDFGSFHTNAAVSPVLATVWFLSTPVFFIFVCRVLTRPDVRACFLRNS